jgi:hypothetical protein
MNKHLHLRSQPRQPTGSGNKTPAKSRLSCGKTGKTPDPILIITCKKHRKSVYHGNGNSKM